VLCLVVLEASIHLRQLNIGYFLGVVTYLKRQNEGKEEILGNVFVTTKFCFCKSAMVFRERS